MAYALRIEDQVADQAPDALGPLIAEWGQTLKAKRMAVAEQHMRRVQLIAAAMGWQRLADVNLRDLHRWYAAYSEGRAASTLANNVCALRQFFKYIKGLGLIDHNPAQALDLPPGERGEGSRACTEAELARLIAVARHSEQTNAKARRYQRSSIYIVAAFTGLRRLEIAKLRVRMIEPAGVGGCEGGWLHLEKQVGKARKRKAIKLPMHPQAAIELARVIKGKGPDDPVFEHPFVAAKSWYADLQKAGIERTDARGRVLSFHGLRKTFATNLAANGVQQRSAQALMRHSSPAMTANIYQQAELLPLAREVQKLPMLNNETPLHKKSERNVATLLDFGSPITETVVPVKVAHTSAHGNVPQTDKPCGWVSVPLGILNICTF
jgi:integrase